MISSSSRPSGCLQLNNSRVCVSSAYHLCNNASLKYRYLFVFISIFNILDSRQGGNHFPYSLCKTVEAIFAIENRSAAKMGLEELLNMQISTAGT